MPTRQPAIDVALDDAQLAQLDARGSIMRAAQNIQAAVVDLARAKADLDEMDRAHRVARKHRDQAMRRPTREKAWNGVERRRQSMARAA